MPRPPRPLRLTPLASLPTLAVAGLLLTACGSSSTSSAGSASSTVPSASTSASSAAQAGTINVFAAASLKEAFTTLGASFQAAHPGTKVVFNFGPSSGLATSIVQGAPADVFASASTKNMDQVVAAKLASAPVNFARNTMEIAVPAANPAKVTQLADLAKSSVKVALCQAAVPCGVTAAKVFANAGLKVTPVTQEVDVKSVLAKVTLDEVDAGVVYVTDVRSAGPKVKGVLIPKQDNAATEYPIAPLTGSKNAATAKQFSDYVTSADGAKVLVADGFLKP